MNRSVRRNLSGEFQAETSRGHQDRIFVLLRHPRLHFHLFENDRARKTTDAPPTFARLPVEIVAGEEGQQQQQGNHRAHHSDDQHQLLLADFFLQQNIWRKFFKTLNYFCNVVMQSLP